MRNRRNRSVLQRMLAAMAVATMVLPAAVAHAASGPPRTLSDFVLFALRDLRSKGLTMTAGAVGVNDGSLYSHGPIAVPQSALVADTVRVDEASTCGALFSNHAMRTGPGCGPAQAFSGPILTTPIADCGFPAQFPACDPARPIQVASGEVRHLPPGVYGDVHAAGGPVRGTVLLDGGAYVFCSLRLGRSDQLLTAAPATVAIAGDMTLGPASRTAPASAAVAASELRLMVAGTHARLARRADVRARVCAPAAMLRITAGVRVEGTILARTIHTEKMSGTLPAPPDICAGAHCGDGVVNCGEVCDPNAPPIPCSDSADGAFANDSSSGGFVACVDSCSRLDRSQCNASSTTTTQAPGTTTTTTTTTHGTTTTTLDPCASAAHCGDGIVNCGEVCDTALPIPCDGSGDGSFIDGSPGGGFGGGSAEGGFVLCTADCSATDDSACHGTTTTTSAPTTTTSITQTTTTVSTTSTTLDPCSSPSHCGDGVVNCGEVCDPNVPVPCGVGSAEAALLEAGDSSMGAFQRCTDDCTTLDASTCPTTTTTVTSTSSTTTTTIDACTASTHCGDGILNCNEPCDPSAPSQPLCSLGSPAGGFVGCTSECTIDRGQCPAETCGNCADDDGDGLIDFEDPDCCGSQPMATLELRRGRIRTAKGGGSRLRLRSILGVRPSFKIDLKQQDLYLQIRNEDSMEAFCAQIPAAQFKSKGLRRSIFRDATGSVASAKGLRRVVVRLMKSGKVRMAARGGHVVLSAPAAGNLRITVGLRSPASASTPTQCTSARQRFVTSVVRGGVRFP